MVAPSLSSHVPPPIRRERRRRLIGVALRLGALVLLAVALIALRMLVDALTVRSWP